MPLRDCQRLLQVRERSRLLLMRIGSGIRIAELAARTPAAGRRLARSFGAARTGRGRAAAGLRGGVVFVPELLRLNRVQRTNPFS